MDATNSSGTLTYTTGISGTQGVETTNADGTTNPNDTQNIVVNTSSATLNINGAGGVDKFNIEASSFTKTLTIAGNLGTVPNYEEAKNNYDSVRIDLSKTSGVDLNISNLLVSNPNDEGIIITASKGADNITLVAGANHDVIEFSAGSGSSAGAREVYSVDLGNLRLANSQSFSIDGLTITNVGDTGIVRAAEIAKAIADYANNGTVAAGFNITGKLGSLTGDWAGATASASGGMLNITAQPNRNLKDLDLKFGGNGSTNAPTNITANITAGSASASASISAANPVPVAAGISSASASLTLSQVSDGSDEDVITITIGGTNYKINASANGADATPTLDSIIGALNGLSDTSVSNLTVTFQDSAGTTLTTNPLAALGVVAASSGGKLVFEADTDFAPTSASTIKVDTTTWSISPVSEPAGTPDSVAPVGNNLVWTGKMLSADQTATEILKVSIAGNVYSVKATATKDTTVLPDDIIEMLGTGSGTTNGITYTITNSAGGAEAEDKIKDVLANIGVKVDVAAGGIAGNEIALIIDDNTKLPDSAATITITPSNVFNANNTAVSWSAQASQDEPAQPDTSTIVINGHNIVFSNVVLTASALEAAVFELITNGTLDSLSASDRAKVSIDGQTFNRANAKDNKALFVIEGTEYRQVSGGGIELVLTDPASYTGNASFEFSQTNGNGDGSDQTFNIVGAHGDSYGQVVVTFNALAAGQSYTFDGKTIIATKNLSAEQVANAFTLTTDDTVDGAVVVSDFENIGEDVLYYVPAGSSTLTIQGTSLTSIPAGINTTITGTGSLGVNTNGVSASTTTQGSDGSGTRADSYVVFAETTNAAGEITAIAANTSAMDSITNFDVANDGLRLRDGNGGYYGEGQVATSISAHTIYVGANSTLAASVANGIISFSVNNGDNGSATAESITLDQKLHVATHDIGTNKVAGFEHNGDFYVVATGGISGASTDDIVVKLNGVAGVSDITNLLA
ncbi:MAG: hypothetical protein K2N70_03820 [Helicobacter sp.]|nr:hypothetical protein [Helicobacter sp.]